MVVRLNEIPRRERAKSGVAVGSGASYLGFEEIDRRANRIAAGCAAAGFLPGQRIVLLLPSTLDFVTAYLGAHRAGLVTISINPMAGADELGAILAAMRPRAIVAPVPGSLPFPAIEQLVSLRDAHSDDAVLLLSGATPEDARNSARGAVALSSFGEEDCRVEPVGRDLSDEAAIFFTSGTSGRSKGVSLSESALGAHAHMVVSHLSYTSDDIILTPLPFSHIFGQVTALLAGLAAGAHLEAVPRPTPDLVFEAMEHVQPTIFLAVPTTIAALNRIARAAPDRARRASRRLRLVVAGGAAIAESVAGEFAELFGVMPLQGYGMTETAGVISLPSLGAKSFSPAVGRVLPSFDYRVDAIDPADPASGELLLKGDNLLRGYYVDGELEVRNPDDWFPTGDLVHLDENGQIEIFDRKKEMILRGGYNVYPSEVEAVLAAHPAVSIAAVAGVAHADLGQEVAAFVQLKPHASATPQELVDWCRNRLSLYKYPRIVKVVDHLPLTPTGKVLKRALPFAELARDIS